MIAARKLLPWRYIGLALAVAGIGYSAYSWAWQRGHDSRNDEVRLVTDQRDAALWSVGQLSDGLNTQNDAIAAQGRLQERVAVASDKAAVAGAARRGALDAAAARVEAVEASGAACGAVAGDVRALWGVM